MRFSHCSRKGTLRLQINQPQNNAPRAQSHTHMHAALEHKQCSDASAGTPGGGHIPLPCQCRWADCGVVSGRRYQDIRAEFSNDGLHGQWIRMREWCFRHCFNKSKYQVEDVDTQIVALKHHEEIKILKSQSQRHLPTAEPTAEPDLVPARVDGGEAAGGGDARP